MRAVILVLIVIILAVIAAIVTGFLDINQIRGAKAPQVTATGNPVGAVVTCRDEIIAEARNAMRGSFDPTAHGEMEAIRAAATALGTSRLDDCTLWVTLEPCAMCAAALSLARIKELRFGAEDSKS